jgi:GTP cyclohydrolase I
MLRPKGVVVFMRASHFCMKWRGVKEDNFLMSTIAMRGVLREEKWEQEFYQFLNLTLPKAAT